MKTSTKQSAKKLWGGRFSQQTSSLVEQFTQSVSFDQRLARYDITGSIAHAEMLRKIGLLSKAEAAKIIAGLKAIGRDIASGTFVFREELEDVHMNIEAELTRQIGPAAQKLHTGRSRNDQVALDERLYLRDILAQVGTEVAAVQKALVALATRNKALIMPGFTHLQHAMPVLVAHHLLAYVEMSERDKSRLADAAKRANVMPL
ncbi:argininosuccinate lyase, partial [bacterium]|nr:argininosuccinate lyase [bacterium]